MHGFSISDLAIASYNYWNFKVLSTFQPTSPKGSCEVLLSLGVHRPLSSANYYILIKKDVVCY